MNNRPTEKEANTINELSWVRFDLYYDFLKKVLTVSISLLALIVGLSGISNTVHHNTMSNYNIYLIIAFVLALSTLALGIVCVSIGLYGFVDARDRLLNNYLGKVAYRLEHGESKDSISSGTDPGGKSVYTYAIWIGFVSLLSSVLLFTVYLILLTFD